MTFYTFNQNYEYGDGNVNTTFLPFNAENVTFIVGNMAMSI